MKVKPKREIEKKTPIKLGKNDRYFYIDFNDANFPVRLKQGREEIATFLEAKRQDLGIEDISQLQTKGRTVEETESRLNIFYEIDTFIKNKINFIFDYDVSKEVFGIVPCTWITKKGEFYFDNFLNGLIPLVEEKFGVQMQYINNHICKTVNKKRFEFLLKRKGVNK